MRKIDTAPFKRLIIRIAEEEGVPANVLLAIAEKESGFNPNAKNFTTGEKSYGMFQINTKAHPDYKGGFDPEQNTRYAAKFLKRLIKQNNGNISKAVERYNGAGQAARNYSNDVMNRILPKYKNVANNAARIPVNIAQATKQQLGERNMNQQPLQGGVSQTQIQQPNLLGDYTTNALIGAATTPTIPFVEALRGFRAGRVSYNQLANQFPNEVQRYKITPEMQGAALNPTEQMLLERRFTLTPEQLQQVANINQQGNQQMVQQITQYDQGLRDYLSQQYNNQLATIQNNPMLQNQGYYIDPEMVDRSNTAAAMMYGLTGRKPITYTDIQNANYQANLANKYGIPYEQLMAAQRDAYNKTVAAAQTNVANAMRMYEQGQITERQLQESIQKNNAAIVGMAQKGMELDAEYQQDLGKQILANQGDIAKQEIANIGQQQQQAMANAGDIVTGANTNMTAMYNTGLQTDAQNYRTDKTYDAMMEHYRTMRDINAQNLPANVIRAQGNYWLGLSGIPNVNYSAAGQSIGIPQPTADAMFNYNPNMYLQYGGNNPQVDAMLKRARQLQLRDDTPQPNIQQQTQQNPYNIYGNDNTQS